MNIKDYINHDALKKDGFYGFHSVSELRNNPDLIPDIRGIYLILKPNITSGEEYLEIGTGGHFKGRNPNVSIDKLSKKWIENVLILYIGKAGGEKHPKRTLRIRLEEYLRFGTGEDIGHWGGRYIWQLKYSEELIVCWKALPEEDPETKENEVIRDFKNIYGKYPFANLKCKKSK